MSIFIGRIFAEQYVPEVVACKKYFCSMLSDIAEHIDAAEDFLSRNLHTDLPYHVKCNAFVKFVGVNLFNIPQDVPLSDDRFYVTAPRNCCIQSE